MTDRLLSVLRAGAAPAGLLLMLTALPGLAPASPTEVVKAVFTHAGGGAWQVAVTLRHADSGWEHYANVWVVETLDGKELGRRVLFHPHENEQPFTRSDRVTIPDGITRVRVRAGDKPNGMNSNTVVVELTTPKGDRYEVR